MNAAKTTALLALTALLASPAARAAEARYKLDTQHTFVTFEIVHNNTSTVRGRFGRSEATIDYDRDKAALKVDVTVDVAALSTGVGPLDGALKGRNFLDTSTYPTATFVSTGTVFADGKPTAITGELTLLGKSLPLTLNAVRFNCYDSRIFQREICGGDFEASLLRSQWGMSYGQSFGIPDEVRLVIQIEAIRQ